MYGTAQRQLDTRTSVAGWILSGEDYIMRSIFERAPVTFVPVSGKLSGVCTRKHYIILYELLNEIYNINSIYTINLQTLSLYVPINQSLNLLSQSYWKAAHVQYVSCSTVWQGVVNGFGVENRFIIGDWISINLFKFAQSVGWKVRKYLY